LPLDEFFKNRDHFFIVTKRIVGPAQFDIRVDISRITLEPFLLFLNLPGALLYLGQDLFKGVSGVSITRINPVRFPESGDGWLIFLDPGIDNAKVVMEIHVIRIPLDGCLIRMNGFSALV